LVSYRNCNPVKVMKNLDLGQRFSFGIKWARETIEGNGKPPPEFKVSNSNVCCILKKASDKKLGKNVITCFITML